MTLKKDVIGKTIIKVGYGSIKIEDNPDKFKKYKALGLDVFEAEEKKVSKPKKAKKDIDTTNEK